MADVHYVPNVVLLPRPGRPQPSPRCPVDPSKDVEANGTVSPTAGCKTVSPNLLLLLCRCVCLLRLLVFDNLSAPAGVVEMVASAMRTPPQCATRESVAHMYKFGSGTGSCLNILSAGIEATRLGHLVTVLQLGANLPDRSSDEEDNAAEDGRVLLPVGRLSVPTTRRRPDVLGIAGVRDGGDD